MSKIIITFEDNGILVEIKRIISHLDCFEIYSADTDVDIIVYLEEFLNKNDIHFLIFAKQLNHNSLVELHEIYLKFPWIFSIYYCSRLKNKEFHALYDSGVSSCIIGAQRAQYMKTNLPHFWEKHWKRIPAFIYPADKKNLSPRAKLIIKNIENQHIREYNIKSLSEKLKISEAHFRIEFKNLFGINFRRFKQKLFAHYESVLLYNKQFKPDIVYAILNYKTIGNYSRSFKTRHGECWRKFKQTNEYKHNSNNEHISQKKFN